MDFNKLGNEYKQLGVKKVLEEIPVLRRLPSDGDKAKDKILAALASLQSTKQTHPSVAVPENQLDLEASGFKRTRMALPFKHEGWFPETWRADALHAHAIPGYYLIHKDNATLSSLGAHARHDLLPALVRRLSGKQVDLVKDAAMLPGAAMRLGTSIKNITTPPLAVRAKGLLAHGRTATAHGLPHVQAHVQHFQQNYPDVLAAMKSSPLGQHMDEGALVQNFMMSHQGGSIHDTARSLGILGAAGAPTVQQQAAANLGHVPAVAPMMRKAAAKSVLTKTAFLPPIIAGPLGHILTNLGGRAAHHSSNLAEVMAHRGFQHGSTGSSIAPMAKRSIHAITGPEATATYDLARKLGEHIYNVPPEQRQHLLQAIASGAAIDHPSMHHIRNSPILGDIMKAVQHDVAGTEPTLKAKGMAANVYGHMVNQMARPTSTPFDAPGRTLVSNAVGAAPMAAMLAGDAPGSLAHFGVNTAREVIGRSALGKRVMDQNVKKGLEGKVISPTVQKVVDIAASPAFLDPYRMGRAFEQAGVGAEMRKSLGDMPVTALPKMVGQMASQAKAAPQAALEQATSHVRSLAKPPTPPSVPHVSTPSVPAPAPILKAASIGKVGELAEDGEHKLQGHIDFQGMRIAVENRKGSVRSGTTPDGHEWHTKMVAPYGYLEAPAKGKDGDSLDVYVGPKKDAPDAYVVHQHKPDGTGHDEDKIILGVKDEEEAKKLYLKHYDDTKFLGPISKVPIDRLKEIIEQNKKITKVAELDKNALIERLIRLGATDVPNTPRLVMRHRAPAELGALQNSVEKAYDARVTDPLMGVVKRVTARLPEGRVRSIADKGARLVAEDPLGTLAANLVPVPGAHPAYVAGKKLLERGIDRAFPVPLASKTAASKLRSLVHLVEEDIMHSGVPSKQFKLMAPDGSVAAVMKGELDGGGGVWARDIRLGGRAGQAATRVPTSPKGSTLVGREGFPAGYDLGGPAHVRPTFEEDLGEETGRTLRGLGMGRKLLGMVLEKHPTVRFDSTVSEPATHTLDNFAKSKRFSVTTSPNARSVNSSDGPSLATSFSPSGQFGQSMGSEPVHVVSKTAAVYMKNYVGTHVKVPTDMIVGVNPEAAKNREERFGQKHHVTLLDPGDLNRLKKKGYKSAYIKQVFDSISPATMTIKRDPVVFDTPKRVYNVLKVDWPQVQKAREQLGLRPSNLHVTIGATEKVADSASGLVGFIA